MTNTNVIASSPNISGNIGSCEVKSTDVSVTTFQVNTIAVNSCTGEIVSQHQYYDWTWILIPLIIVIIITTLRVSFD